MTLDLSTVEKRMQPGAWFASGFLLENTSLAEVLDKDRRTLAALSVTAEEVGNKLAELLAQAGKSDWFWPLRTAEFKVEIRRRRGFITCPWAPDEFEPCNIGHMTPPTANQFLIQRGFRQRLEGFELSVHLIRDHEFFGGPGSRLRIEPEQAVAVLGLG
jgi:hypothetical protein